jgi:sulfite reductase (NADPH) hemoprotein beta-component
MNLHIVTANRLGDGAVVYLSGDGNWNRNIDKGMAVGDENAEALLARAQSGVDTQTVIVPYLIEVADDGHVRRPNRRPLRQREQIRADGPTVSGTEVPVFGA